MIELPERKTSESSSAQDNTPTIVQLPASELEEIEAESEADKELVAFMSSRMDQRRNQTQVGQTSLSGYFQTLFTFLLGFVMLVLAMLLMEPKSSARTSSRGGPMNLRNWKCPESADNTTLSGLVDVKDVSHRVDDIAAAFPDVAYGQWGFSYEQYKQGMFHWKSTKFVHLSRGSTIFNVASGNGLNLIMTLEILNEVKELTGLVVYGNAAELGSNEIVNGLVDLPDFLPAQASKGRADICLANSGNVSAWAPNNVFDLVYTGYLHPLRDPLGLNLKDAALRRRYRSICKRDNPTKSSRADSLQKAQDDHFGNQIRSMIEIARPGAVIIIEQVSIPICAAAADSLDWGGVGKEFWKNATATYGWEVDEDSIVTEDDTSLFPHRGNKGTIRYHVSMEKLGYGDDDDS